MSTANKLFQAASGGAGGDKVYVEDVFSTHLYNGTGSAQTITNGIDLDGEGGLIWFKNRGDSYSHALFDSERSSFGKYLQSNDSAGETDLTGHVTASSTGFQLSGIGYNITNNVSGTYASWSFRKQPGFFDIVTYTGNNTGQTLSHNLGCVPAMILVKRTDFGDDWVVYHVGSDSTAPEDYSLKLNDTDARSDNNGAFNDTAPTATQFTVGNSAAVSQGNASFVAYLFAGTNDSDSQIFGAGGDEAIIKCGKYETNLDEVVNLGFEPQWILIKPLASGNWRIIDNMRGWTNLSGNNAYTTQQLLANGNNAEFENSFARLTSTGFEINQSGGGAEYVYVAIRRPMKTPAAGTEVFDINTRSGTGAAITTPIATGFPVDFLYFKQTAEGSNYWGTRLTGQGYMYTNSNSAEVNNSTTHPVYGMQGQQDGYTIGDGNNDWNGSSKTYIDYAFKRATGFMDVVAYTGNFTNGRAITHNLGVAPELIITKRRSASDSWLVGANFTGSDYDYLNLHTTSAANNNAYAFRYKSQPTATSYTVDQDNSINGNNETYVAYMFASLAGVSKVGSYTGTGSDLNVDCGFASGARFVLIKRTDDSGGWYLFDSARGIIAGNDPYNLLNNSTDSVTNTDYIDPLNAGFTVTSSASSTINVSSGEYIFLAIA